MSQQLLGVLDLIQNTCKYFGLAKEQERENSWTKPVERFSTATEDVDMHMLIFMATGQQRFG